ncbi:hypothetical protein [Conexibacter sp. DBS9H8]|uniref:hypothetical protein n=1 Tax=Conexibacter sp. DBS9H8 TaxID=2937801 RepID=UPI00200DE8AF|nr:hypothetical protein [Conexibacter sp. DBS9H8]
MSYDDAEPKVRVQRFFVQKPEPTEFRMYRARVVFSEDPEAQAPRPELGHEFALMKMEREWKGLLRKYATHRHELLSLVAETIQGHGESATQ